MKLGRRLRSSLGPLLTHRVRTALALSGVAVGVAAVVVSSAIGRGAEEEMARTIEAMGTNLLIVKPLPVKRLVARRAIEGLATTLDVEDHEAIAELALVGAAAPAIEGNAPVKADAIAMKTTIRGTTPVFLSLRRFEMAAGRFLAIEDDRAARRVAVLGARVSETVFPDRRAIGQEVRIRGVPYEVIGVLRSKGTTADGADQDNQVLVPARTAARRIFNTTRLTAVYVGVREPVRMNDVEAEIQRLLRARHQSGVAGRNEDFAIQNTAKIRSVQQEMTASLSLFAAGLAAIALLVGGIGILA
jgi:putative ABC transport system permease protein